MTKELEQGLEPERKEVEVPFWLKDRFAGIGWEVALPSDNVPLNGQDWIRMWWAGKGEPVVPGKLPER